MWDQVSHPYRTTGKIILLYVLLFTILDSKLEEKYFTRNDTKRSIQHCKMFRDIVSFYGEELSTKRSTPNLEDHPLLAARDCLFSILDNIISHPCIWTQGWWTTILLTSQWPWKLPQRVGKQYVYWIVVYLHSKPYFPSWFSLLCIYHYY
jgi:hypothetical protein